MSDLGVFDFATPDRSMRLALRCTRVSRVEQVREATGFALAVADDVPDTREPTADELRLIREVIDPAGLREREVRPMTASMETRAHRALGVRHPIVQTGMGWVAGPRLVSAAADAGALGHPRLRHDDRRSSCGRRSARSRPVRTRPSGSICGPTPGTPRERVRIIVDEGVRVASFALAPSRELIARLKDAGVVVIPSVGARRHAEKVAAWGADAVIVQGGEGGGHTGDGGHDRAAAAGRGRGGHPGGRGGRLLRRARAWSRRWPTGRPGIAMGTRFLLTSDRTVPDAVKARYLAAAVKDITVTTAVDGLPHRMLRTRAGRLAGALRAAPRALVRAVRHAAALPAAVRADAGPRWSATAWR